MSENLPHQMARLVRFVPEQVRDAEGDPEVMGRLGDEPLGRALSQVCEADFSPWEWGALLECHAVVSRLGDRDETIKIDYRGPDTGRASEGVNELPLSEWSRNFGVPPGYRVLLFALIRQSRPRTCLELGTAAGFSGLHIAQALAVNGDGMLHTVEGDDSSHEIGRETLWLVRDLTVAHLGLFDEVLDRLLPDIAPLDFAFVDGAHTGEDEVRYAERLAEHLSPGALAVYDDIRWSAEMTEAWKEIRTRPEVAVSLDFGKFGVVQVREGDEEDPTFHFTSSVEGNFGVHANR